MFGILAFPLNFHGIFGPGGRSGGACPGTGLGDLRGRSGGPVPGAGPGTGLGDLRGRSGGPVREPDWGILRAGPGGGGLWVFSS